MNAKFILVAITIFAACTESDAQPGHGRNGERGNPSSKSPAGAEYVISDESVKELKDEALTTTVPDYNVIQVTNGKLTLSDCNITKKGDYSSNYTGDATSFYGTNSAVYASGKESVINIKDCIVTTVSKGSNAVFATNGARIDINGITIDNSASVSRGLHCTGGGIINASNVNITTRSETSSAIATDRGGGTVNVTGGSVTARGSKSAVIYSTGEITVTDITGLSEKGPIATIEGSNRVTVNNCRMTSRSDTRGILLHQSTSGDADGSNPVCSVTNSTLSVTSTGAPLCFVTNVSGTLTLTDVTLNVASGKLMSVEYYKRGNGSTGNLLLNTTKESWTYNGDVCADDVNNVSVTIGNNVIWNGAANTGNTAKTATVTVEKNAVWNLTADTYLTGLNNNGTINEGDFKIHIR